MADVNDYNNEVQMIKKERAKKAKALGAFYVEQTKQRNLKAIQDKHDSLNNGKLFLDYNKTAKERWEVREL
jgi:hypothetical protein